MVARDGDTWDGAWTSECLAELALVVFPPSQFLAFWCLLSLLFLTAFAGRGAVLSHGGKR